MAKKIQFSPEEKQAASAVLMPVVYQRKCNLICVIILLYGILHSQYVAHKYHSSHYY